MVVVDLRGEEFQNALRALGVGANSGCGLKLAGRGDNKRFINFLPVGNAGDAHPSCMRHH
jgi:hypothetical protein